MAATIRIAEASDAAGILAIYAPVVRETAISFELAPPTTAEMAERMAGVLQRDPWLVLERQGVLAGYAYALPFRSRPAYRWTVESTVYVHAGHRRARVGQALMEALLAGLELQGYGRVVAGITLPNAGSVGLHESLGFRPVGVFPGVGHKLDAWHDVGFWELELRELSAPPRDPRTVADLVQDVTWAAALERAAGSVR